MNYKKSKDILKKIEKANNILINCHRRPDPDSVSSAVAMAQVVKKIGKDAKIISPDPVPKNLSYLQLYDEIDVISYDNFDFGPFDIFVVLDSGGWDVVTDNKLPSPPKNIFIVQVDHHDIQEKFANLSLVDEKVSSTSEIVYCLLEDWNFKPDKNIATSLLSGMISDTICFKIPTVSARTLRIASKLMGLGADRDTIMDKQFNSVKFNLLKFYGDVMQRIRFEKEHQFVWSAIPYDVFKKHGKPSGAKNATANTFFAGVENSKFGVLMVEEIEGRLLVSFRSAGRFDTSRIAKKLGGGGHKDSSATKIENIDFDEGVKKVISAAKEYAKEE